MDNKIISLNYNHLKKFIDSKVNFNNEADLFITFKYNITNIIYNKILQSLDIICANNKIQFINERNVLFQDNDYQILFKFKDNNIFSIIEDMINKQLLFDHLYNTNTIQSEYFKSLIVVNDKLYKIYINEKTLVIDKKIMSGPIFENKQIVLIDDIIKLIANNDNTYYFEFTFPYTLDSKVIQKHIDTLTNVLFSNKKIIIENNLYLENYKQAINAKSLDILKTRNPKNILIEDLLDKINVNHCVFTKTDGERVFIMIFNSIILYIDNILNCYFINTCNDNSLNIIFDAEMYEDTFYIFDLLYSNQIDNVNDLPLFTKLEKSNELIKKFHLVNLQVKNPIYPTSTKEEFFSRIVELINVNKSSNIKSDGIIFQSLMSLNKTREKKIDDYKWKPIEETSLDFFIIINDTIIRREDGNYYKIDLYGFETVNLDNNTNFEEIKKFTDTYVKYDGNYLKTLNNEIIVNNIVIEFIPEFDDFNNITWTPLRIRYDKSMAVIKYNRKHGNNIMVCEQTLEYLKSPILIQDYVLLSNNYEDGYTLIGQKIKDKKIVTKRDPVNDKIFDFIKTNVITTMGRYLNFNNVFEYVNMIDLNCRNGIDLLKIYEYAVLYGKGKFNYDGYNDNRIEIESTFNGAISRYNNFRMDRTKSNFPICTFIIADVPKMIETVTKKYNHLISYEFYRYQFNYSTLKQVKILMDKVLVPKSLSYIIIADIVDNQISNNFIQKNIINGFIVKSSLQDVLKIFYNYKIIELKSFVYHLEILNNIKNLIPVMNNKKTAEFLTQTIYAFNKIDHSLFSKLYFCILIKM